MANADSVAAPAATSDAASPAAADKPQTLDQARAARRASLDASAPARSAGAAAVAGADGAAAAGGVPSETVASLLTDVRAAREKSAEGKALKQAREEADGLKAQLADLSRFKDVGDDVVKAAQAIATKRGRKLSPDELVALTDLLEGDDEPATPTAEELARKAARAELDAAAAEAKAARDKAKADEDAEEEANAAAYVGEVSAALKAKADKLPSLSAVGLDPDVCRACFEDVYTIHRQALDAETMANCLDKIMSVAGWTPDVEAAWVGKYVRQHRKAPTGRELYRALKAAYEAAPDERPGQAAAPAASNGRPPTAGVTPSMRRDPGYAPPPGETLEQARERRKRELDAADERRRS